MEAVAKGDMKTAQRMVDAAAKAAGLKKKNLVRTLFSPREVDEIRPRAIEAVRNMAKEYVFNMEYSMDEEERWSNVGFDNNKLGFKTSGDDSYSIKIDYVNDTDDWLNIVETNNGKKSLLDYSLRPVEYKVPSDPVTYDDSGNVIPLSQRFRSQSEDIRNPRQSVKGDNKGININDEFQDFTGQILRGEKTVETRPSRSLDSRIGKLTGIIRTGIRNQKATLVGYMVIGEPVIYDSVAKFRRDYDKHLVAPGSEHDIKNGLKYGYPIMQVESVAPKELTSRGIVIRRLNPYTKPDLRERLKRKVMAGDKGGNPGQWSARKAQLLAAEYKKAGGGYTGERSASQRSLSKWSKQDWRTKSGKPSLETGERYLPAKAIKSLSPAEYAATTRAKRSAPGQFSRQPRRIAMKTKEFRNPMDPRSAMTQIEGTKKTYAKAAKMLTGKVIDYGAGLGIGTDILRAEGLSVDSFEPYPEKWKGKRPPTFTDSAKIPSASYDSLVSFSVINVVEPDMRKFLFQEVDRILRPNGVALITGRSRSDVEKSTTKIPHLEEGGYLIDEGEEQRYQKGFTQAELERYAKEVLGPGFTVQKNGLLNGASIKISKGKTNPVTRSMIRTKLSRILEPGDRVLDYDRAQGEDLYRLWDMVHTDKPLTKEALTEIEGLLDDDGVLVIQSGEEPSGLQDHFRKATRYQGMLLVQGPMNPEVARINTEKLRRDLE